MRVCAIIAIVLFIFQVNFARANVSDCLNGVYNRSIQGAKFLLTKSGDKTGLTKFAKEFYNDGDIAWSRLIVKDIPEDGLDRKFLGMFTEVKTVPAKFYRLDRHLRNASWNIQGWLTSKFPAFKNTPYRLTPMTGLKNKVRDLALPEKKQLTLGTSLILGTGITYATYPLYSPWVESVIETLADKYTRSDILHRIKTDYRYAEINHMLDQALSQAKTPEEIKAAEDAAFEEFRAMTHSYNAFNKLLEGIATDQIKFESEEQKFQFLLSQPVFEPILKPAIQAFDMDYLKSKNFQVAKDYATRDQKRVLMSLIGIQEFKIFLSGAVPQWLAPGFNPKTLPDDPFTLSVYKKFKDDPFYQDLVSRRDRGAISSERFEYLVLEDIHWQSRFQMWDAKGVTRLALGENGPTSDPLTLEMIRQETLADLTR